MIDPSQYVTHWESSPTLLLLFKSTAVVTVMIAFCNFLVQRKVDRASIGLFLLAEIISIHYMHISLDDSYTNDLWWHMSYVDYILVHWLSPYGYSAQQSSHPPLWYYIIAVLHRFTHNVLGIYDLLLFRFVSWVFFQFFNAYNLLTLRRMGFTGARYYTCAALLLLWPGSAHLASKINSEAMYYAAEAVSFYYLIGWYNENNERDLKRCILFAGLAMLVRTNTVMLFMLIGILMLIALYRGRVRFGQFFTRQWMMVWATLVVVFILNFGNILFASGSNVLDGMDHKGPMFPLTHFISLHCSFTKPFTTWYDYDQGFLEFLLKTSMFGEYLWPSPILAAVMDAMMLTLILYVIAPWFFAKRDYARGLMPYGLYAIISIAFVIFFSWVIRDYPSQDARYVYPLLLCFAVAFGRSHAFYTQQGMVRLSKAGLWFAAAFLLVSNYYFWVNWR